MKTKNQKWQNMELGMVYSNSEFVPLDPEDVREWEAIVADFTVCQICFKAFDKYRQSSTCPHEPVTKEGRDR